MDKFELVIVIIIPFILLGLFIMPNFIDKSSYHQNTIIETNNYKEANDNFIPSKPNIISDDDGDGIIKVPYDGKPLIIYSK